MAKLVLVSKAQLIIPAIKNRISRRQKGVGSFIVKMEKALWILSNLEQMPRGNEGIPERKAFNAKNYSTCIHRETMKVLEGERLLTAIKR